MAVQPRTNTSLDELARSVEHHHEQYLRSLHSFHDVLNLYKRERENNDSGRTTVQGLATPPLRAFTFASDANSILQVLPRFRRDTSDTHDRPSCYPSPKFLPLTPNLQGSDAVPDDEIPFIPLLEQSPSVHGGDSRQIHSDTATAATVAVSASHSHVHQAITPMSFSDDMLFRHLRDSEFCPEFSSLLVDEDEQPLPPWEIDSAQAFREAAAAEWERFGNSTFEVYEVGEDGRAAKLNVNARVEVDGRDFVKYGVEESVEPPDGIVEAPMVWETIRHVNTSGKAVGRITIVQEPTPLMLAALHLTMSPHFDMTELLHHLLSDTPNRGRTHAFMHRAYERTPSSQAYPSSPTMPSHGVAPPVSFAHLRQRSFFFVFKYYTLLGQGLDPAPWQLYEKRPTDKRLDDHIDIAECGSVLALSLGGEPTKTLKMRPRRERAKEGFLFDTFAPWQLLSIQSFPDDEHTVRGDDFQLKSFCSGPYAFLELLIAEYRDAGKRNQVLHERITKLITPPTEFMFDHHLRDKLLFEDKHFTYIRRYFWAYNTLAVINTGIKAMIAAYVDTFTDDVWAGAHPLLWPFPSSSQQSAEAAAAAAADYAARMAVLRRELDKVVSDLGEVLKRNERTRKEIENLRDQLFSGSSIKESRRAIDQGDNIRILTMISMLFLPLTFVTSVFGITEFTIPVTDWRFPLTMVLVCVPFMILLYLIQTRPFIQTIQALHRAAKSLALLPAKLLRLLLLRCREPDSSSSSSSAQDSRSGSASLSPKGRKRRLRLRRHGGSGAAGGGSGSCGGSWRRPWGWLRRRRAGGEENDLGRV
ncbi:hypothetical protein MKX07_007132 [Trichoderma sp. CBMAI-0711]|uniref:Uncharacterized protein n=1 Tax=Trichoderma parareesei TaxID=858221 RepID=A0A2H2ZBG3_TRIPA|nr:hypothetical protein MKX07_007132 [Trichoderma sp. CBMAI-0711]OTA05057.1 hypothetical protein A9Z42_0056810 [Trichoderma parareesei]